MMPCSRRDFMIQGAGVGVAVAMTSGLGILAGRPGILLYDRSIDHVEMRKARTVHSGLVPLDLEQAHSSLFATLNRILDTDPGAVHGLTSPSWRFVVEQLAQRRGLRMGHRFGAVWSLFP